MLRTEPKDKHIPGSVRYCTSHHYACDCREYKYGEMRRALLKIATWAEIKDHGLPDATYATIRAKALDALTCTDHL